MTTEEYIESHTSPEPPWLSDLYRHTWQTRLYPRMCTDHVEGRLLAMLASMVNPRRILELGTFTGYSALCLAEGAPEAIVDTVEIDDEAEGPLRRTFAECPGGSRVRLHIGDALEVVPRIAPAGGWDMVFVDADKRLYLQYLQMLMPLLSSGAFILADNTLWSGKVADPKARDAQTEGLRAFNDFIASDPRFAAVILPTSDGLTLLRYSPAGV